MVELIYLATRNTLKPTYGNVSKFFWGSYGREREGKREGPVVCVNGTTPKTTPVRV
jgi:hypothetical protein